MIAPNGEYFIPRGRSSFDLPLLGFSVSGELAAGEFHILQQDGIGVAMITVFGSINVDLTFRLPHLPSAGETALTPTFSQTVGGKGANQAIAAERDGAPTCFIGCVGADSYGETARKALADLGIDVSGLRTVPGTTGLASVWIDGGGRNQITVASGANRALRADALLDLARPAETLVGLQMETPPSEGRSCHRACRAKESKGHSQPRSGAANFSLQA